MRKLVPAIVGALLVVGCGQPPRSGAVSPTATENAPTASPSVTPAIAVSVAASQYGKVQLLTNAGASCTLAIKIDPGQFGDGPPTALSAVATMDGTVAFAYPAPFTSGTLGRNTLTSPGLVWAQTSLAKSWKIRERMKFNACPSVRKTAGSELPSRSRIITTALRLPDWFNA